MHLSNIGANSYENDSKLVCYLSESTRIRRAAVVARRILLGDKSFINILASYLVKKRSALFSLVKPSVNETIHAYSLNHTPVLVLTKARWD